MNVSDNDQAGSEEGQDAPLTSDASTQDLAIRSTRVRRGVHDDVLASSWRAVSRVKLGFMTIDSHCKNSPEFRNLRKASSGAVGNDVQFDACSARVRSLVM